MSHPRARRVRDARIRPQRGEVGQLPDPPGAQADEEPEAGEVANLANAAHVSLHVGLEVVTEGLARVEPLIVDAWVEAREQDIVQRVASARSLPLCQREGQQLEQRGPARQGLADGIGEAELLAAREHEETVAPFLVREHLEIGQQGGNVLNFIQDGTLVELFEEAPWVGLGEFPLVRRFQVGICQTGEGRAAQGGLPGLTRPGHGHERVLLE